MSPESVSALLRPTRNTDSICERSETSSALSIEAHQLMPISCVKCEAEGNTMPGKSREAYGFSPCLPASDFLITSHDQTVTDCQLAWLAAVAPFAKKNTFIQLF